MDIAITPDTYTPSVDNNGNYVDNIPIIRHGLYCPCGSRKDKLYETNTKFVAHTKTKVHQKWLLHLNQNKANYYTELLKSKELVDNQQKIIVQLEQQLKRKSMTIDYLTEQLTFKVAQLNTVDDLLDIN